MALLTRGQRTFAGQLASRTGLDPRVIGSWLLAEESGGAARSYEGRHYHNWLNIARTDSGDAHGAHSSVWSDPVSAANATAEWLQGRGRIAKEYGRPAGGITRILGAKGPAAQINAIATSGWASSGYNGGSTLRSLFSELGGEHIPTGGSAAAGGAPAVGGAAAAEGAQAAPAAPSGYVQHLAQVLQAQAAQPQPIGQNVKVPSFAGRSAGSLGFQQQEKSLPGLQRLLERSVAPAAPESGETGAEVTPAPQTGSGSGYVNPYGGFKKGRVDQGIDFSGTPGQAIRAIGDAKVLHISPNWYSGQPYVGYELTSGPQKGKVVYVAEQIAPSVRPGQRVRAGQVIGRYANRGTALETGFGTRVPGQTLAKATTGYTEGQRTNAGVAFERFLRSLG